ncbi:MAG TPA: hypothetical protein DHW82_03790, partial [Spirochaetia bacterium]|nr:hypothetical protein [Spirochaetia bacterium]
FVEAGLKEKSDSFDIQGEKILVSSKSDLLKAKESIHPLRDKDIYDISQLKELLKNEQQAD